MVDKKENSNQFLERPRIINRTGDLPKDSKKIRALKSAIEEWFFIENPQFRKGMPECRDKLEKFIKDKNKTGIWVYYPWNNIAIETVPEDIYFKIRTARNRELITGEEQQKYRKIKIGIAGLSVGSGIVSALTISGGPKTIKLADFDVIEIGNLNRIRAGLKDVGSNKAEVAARQIWDIDPFADVHIWKTGLNKENISDFMSGSPKIDIFIDEMDSLDLKVISRVFCRTHRIPVLMVTDNGDSVILDVERFDLEPKRPIFNERVRESELLNMDKRDRKKWIDLSTKIIGKEFMTKRLLNSLGNIGKTISGVPQLGTTASVAGALVSLVVRRMANNQNMPSGRYVFSLDKDLK